MRRERSPVFTMVICILMGVNIKVARLSILLLSFVINFMQMARNENDPDLNLQSFNDHGIFTIDELNELFPVVKPYFSALHLNNI